MHHQLLRSSSQKTKMKSFITFSLLVALVVAAPFSEEEEENTVITKNDYPESLVIYEGVHEIADIMVPLNSASETDSLESSEEDLKKHLLVFFIEADFEEDGSRTYHGIYVYRDGKVTKVMDEGKAFAASADDSTYVFFGAQDGLYVYNPETQSADKYGDFDYSIKDIAKENNNDVIYILTDDRELYKVYDAATRKEKIEDVDAEQIVIDYANNMYYYGPDKKPYVRTADGETIGFEDIPDGAEVRLFRPSLFNGEAAEFLVDNVMYTLYPDGKSKPANLEFEPDAIPTAYSMETAIFRYFGFQKKIYEFDFLSMIESEEKSEA